MSHLRGERKSPPMNPLPFLTTSSSSIRDPTPPLTPTSSSSATSSPRSASSRVGTTFTNPTELSLQENHDHLDEGGPRVVGEDYTNFDVANLDVHPLLRGSAAPIEGGSSNAGTAEVKSPQLSLFPRGREASLEINGNANIPHVDRSRRRRSEEKRDAEDRLEEEEFWRLGMETVQARIVEKFAEIERMKERELTAIPDVEAEASERVTGR